MAAAMEVVLSPRGAVIFHQVVKCHQKVGKEVALEATGEELKMATMNDAQTVTMVSSFHRSFFWSFVLDPNDPFRATVLTRLLVNALTKTPRGDRLVMSDNTSHAFLSILGDSKHGICTTQCLAYRESDLAAPLPHIGQRPRRHVIRLSAKDLDTVIRHMDKKAGGGGGRGANLTHEMRLCLDRGNQHINFRSYDDVTEDPIPKDDAAQQPHQQQQQQQQAVKRTTRSITITGTSFACFDIGHSSQGDGGGASGAASGSRGSTQGSVPLPKESWFVFPVKEIKALTALAAQVHSEVSLIFNRPGRPVVATIGVKAQMASHDDEYLFQNLTDALIQQLGTYDMGHFETDAGNEGGPVTANLHAWGSILWLSTIDTDMEPYDDDMYFDPTENDQQQPQDAPQPPPAAAAGAGAPPPPAPNDMDDEGLDDLLDGLNDEWLQQQRQQQQDLLQVVQRQVAVGCRLSMAGSWLCAWGPSMLSKTQNSDSEKVT
uniref:Uncharacterized protein n=1 Tax=Vitrella brassicaformis TaxID=1169539 RepID=A0A7S1JNB2_9ALVE|mmetsp:Transcript_17017/g.40883  ORF Transcript_17017/g.40883 Transcript_17017/m.40883 type:complete len:488 (+) Transcript_17017:88-1551(+)